MKYRNVCLWPSHGSPTVGTDGRTNTNITNNAPYQKLFRNVEFIHRTIDKNGMFHVPA